MNPATNTPTLLEVEPTRPPRSTAGVFSGALFRRHRPDAYQQIIELRAQGLSVRNIASQIAGVSTNTVLAVLSAERSAIADRKSEMSEACLDIAQLAGEELHRRIEECPAAIETSDLVKIHASNIEKGLLLAGEATQRVESVSKLERVDEHALFAAHLQRLTPAATPGTGRGAEKDAAEKRATPLAIIEVESSLVVAQAELAKAATPPISANGRPSDSKSDGSAAKSQ